MCYGVVGIMRLLCTLLLLLAAAPAHADAALQRAKQDFDAGRALYEQGRYAEAHERFAAGYELVHRPRFLMNMGQCQRQLKQFDRARELFQRYLDEAPDDDPERARVIRFIAELDAEERAAQEHATPAEGTGATTAPPAGTAPSSQVAPSSSAVVAAPAPAPQPHRSFARRNWWIFPVAGVILAGVAVGIYFGVRPADPCANSLGCLDLR